MRTIAISDLEFIYVGLQVLLFRNVLSLSNVIEEVEGSYGENQDGWALQGNLLSEVRD